MTYFFQIALVLIFCIIPCKASADKKPMNHQRIIALTPALTEWVGELLGKEQSLQKLVGVVDHSRYPEWVKATPSVGAYPKIQIEEILKLKPDLILAQTGLNTETQLKTLDRLKLNVVRLPEEHFHSMSAWLVDLGSKLGVQAEAEKMASRWNQAVKEMKQSTAHMTAEGVFVQIEDNPLMTVGGSSFISEALNSAGFKNIFSHLYTPYPRVTVEAVLSSKPDRILILDLIENEIKFQESKKRWDGLLQGSKLATTRVQIVSGDSFARCSFRLIRAIQGL